MTPITYREAVDILGIVEGSLHHAVSRGVLTRLPREGVYQRLAKEQVELFKGKRLSLSALNDKERRLWQKYHDAIEAPADQATTQLQFTQSNELNESIQQLAEQLSRPEIIAGLGALGVMAAALKSSGVPQGVPFQVPRER